MIYIHFKMVDVVDDTGKVELVKQPVKVLIAQIFYRTKATYIIRLLQTLFMQVHTVAGEESVEAIEKTKNVVAVTRLCIDCCLHVVIV